MRTVGVGAEKPKKNAADAKLKKEVKDLKAENEQLKAENADLKTQLAAVKLQNREGAVNVTVC